MTTTPTTGQLPGPLLDALVARKLGYLVISEDWPYLEEHCFDCGQSYGLQPVTFHEYGGEEKRPVILNWPGSYASYESFNENGEYGWYFPKDSMNPEGKRYIAWPPQEDMFGRPMANHLMAIPEYSTDWNAAMSIYELIGEKGCLVWVRNLSSYGHGHECRILPGKNGNKMKEISKTAQSGPLAICLAFLALPDEVISNVK